WISASKNPSKPCGVRPFAWLSGVFDTPELCVVVMLLVVVTENLLIISCSLHCRDRASFRIFPSHALVDMDGHRSCFICHGFSAFGIIGLFFINDGKTRSFQNPVDQALGAVLRQVERFHVVIEYRIEAQAFL